jgi:hypothetical protein
MSVEFPTSCDAAVQPDFNRAVALLHHMTYPEAKHAFRAVMGRDPGCAMARWGIAMTLFQPLWPTRPSAADLVLGQGLVQEGLALVGDHARERAYLHALEAFYRDPEAKDYWARIDRWAAAMGELHAAFPDDDEGTAFYALSLLASAHSAEAVQEHSDRAAALLKGIYARHPGHPGAMHYLVHANDTPEREHEDLDVVQRYETAAPDNPHALHMPTHIYTRLGDWDGSIRGNLRAAEAALKYPVGERGDLVWDEFPHAIEYLVYAYLQQGADSDAAAQIERLRATARIEPSAKTAFHLSSLPARYALERRQWREAAALVPRSSSGIDWDRFPWPEAISWFARGLGAVRAGDADVSSEHEHLAALEARAESRRRAGVRAADPDPAAGAGGWTAHRAHDDDGAIALLQKAAKLEGETPKPPVTPGPTLPPWSSSAISNWSSGSLSARSSITASRCRTTHGASTACSAWPAAWRLAATTRARSRRTATCCSSARAARARRPWRGPIRRPGRPGRVPIRGLAARAAEHCGQGHWPPALGRLIAQRSTRRRVAHAMCFDTSPGVVTPRLRTQPSAALRTAAIASSTRPGRD